MLYSKSEFLRTNNILYAEVINLSDLSKDTYGDINSLPYKGLYSNLLGDDKITNLPSFFGKAKYETWRQGKLTALAFRETDTLVVLFYCTDKQGIESQQYAKELFTKCHNLFD